MKRNFTIKGRIALCVLFVLVCAGICAIFVSCDNDGGSHSDIGGTNVQEMGVDEGDIAKYVGEYLYVLQPDGITVSRTLSNDRWKYTFRRALLRFVCRKKQVEAPRLKGYGKR